MVKSTLTTGTTVACLLAAAVASAEVTKIKCESTNDKYQYCSAKTDYQVRMLQQISDARCEQGKSWGYDKEGVWVDHNCAAEFQVGRSGPSTSQKIAAGAAAGAAILGAMMGGQQPTTGGMPAVAPAGPATEGAPTSTMVGTFQAQHPKTEQQYYVSIDSNGMLEGRVNDKQFFGKVKGQQIYVGAQVFAYRPDGDGFVVFEPGKENEGIRFERVQ